MALVPRIFHGYVFRVPACWRLSRTSRNCLNYGVMEVTGSWADDTLYGNYHCSLSPGHRAKQDRQYPPRS